MHEMITLQLGQQSNYLATHFWNAQESYFTFSDDQESPVNHDIHWRQGIGADGNETFMPRTLIYDLKGGFGSLKQINSLYEIEDDRPPQSLWSGQTVIQKQTPIEASAYQQSLDAGSEPAALTTSTVRYWSDFNRVFYHPKSIIQLSEYELNSTIQPFDKFAAGEELFASLDKEHDILDRDLRPFVEEADHMQGIQIMTSVDDAWGGFASRYLERLRDEYGKTAVWTWGLQSSFAGVTREKRLLKLANKAHTLTQAYRQASLVIPIAMPHVRLPRNVSLDASSQWHTTALLATAVETATLPTRLKHEASRDTMGTVTDLLNVMGKQTVASLRMSVSKPRAEAATTNGNRGEDSSRMMMEDAEEVDLQLDMDFSPSDDIGPSRQNGYKKPHIFGQAVVSRGEPPDSDINEEIEREVVIQRRHAQKPFSRRYRTTLGYPMPDSFPRIFVDGESADRKPLQGPVDVVAALSTDSSVSDRLTMLRSTVSRSIGVEDRETLTNDLAEMAEEYHEGWSSGSDSGDDD